MPPALIGSGKVDFLAFINDGATEEVIHTLIKDYWPSGVLISGGILAALNANHSAASVPQFVVIDISDSERPDVDIERAVKTFHGAKAVVFIGDRNDATLYRTVIKAGGTDYLLKPVDAGELYSTLINASLAASSYTDAPVTQSGKSDQQAKLITVIGVHGGVGTSTIAVNSAYEMAEKFNHNTAIIDLDVHFGTVALALNKEPSVGFRDALESPSRVDTLFIESALVSVTDRLSVLATEERLDDYVKYNGDAINMLVEKVCNNREYVFLDTPRTLIIRFPQLVTEATFVILVTDLTIVGLRDAVTLLEKIQNISPGKDVKVVLNGVRQNADGQVSLRDFEAEIRRPVSVVLPDAPEFVARALNEGKPVRVVAPQSKFINLLDVFCAELDGSELDKTTVSPMQKLFSKFGKK
ncbi:MAG: AAA family ATPase [Holosporales bacterium]|jgi:pilus assembly protein CpaE|nr:AAA family ATPase [Thalassospira sp.]